LAKAHWSGRLHITEESLQSAAIPAISGAGVAGQTRRAASQHFGPTPDEFVAHQTGVSDSIDSVDRIFCQAMRCDPVHHRLRLSDNRIVQTVSAQCFAPGVGSIRNPPMHEKKFGLTPHRSAHRTPRFFGSKLVANIANLAVSADCSG